MIVLSQHGGTLPVLARMRQDSPVFTALGLALTLSMLPTLAALQVDDRLFQGDSVWLKPVKFQIALAIYALSLAFYARWLPPTLRRSRRFGGYCAIVAGAIIAEILWIGAAATLGTASHFNQSSAVWIVLYALMGVFAITLTSASLVFGIAVWRNRATGLSAPLHLSMALGLVLTFVLTLPVAGYLSSNGGHLVGLPAAWDTGLPVFGWSRSAGDLRIAHFLATHALHAVPLAGLVATLVLPAAVAIRAVWLAAASYAVLVAAAFLQALAGLPLI